MTIKMTIPAALAALFLLAAQPSQAQIGVDQHVRSGQAQPDRGVSRQPDQRRPDRRPDVRPRVERERPRPAEPVLNPARPAPSRASSSPVRGGRR